MPAEESQFVDAAVDLHGYLRDLQQLAVDLDFTVFTAHSQVLATLIAEAASDDSSPRVDHDHHDLFVGNDWISGDEGDDLIIGDEGTFLTPLVTSSRLDQVELDSPVSTATWNAARSALAAQQSARETQLASHIQQDHVVSAAPLNASGLSRIAWDYDYELTIGNDEVYGEDGIDTMVGDFGIFVVPIAPYLPATQEETDRLNRDTQQLLTDVEEYLSAGRHERTIENLHRQYLHPHDAHRGGTAAQIAISAGSDEMYGGTGGDFVLADSVSLAIVYPVQSPLERFPLDDPEFESPYLRRDDFELPTYYAPDGATSQVGRDVVYGGAGNDLLYGQYAADRLYGEEGDDVVYGGDGGNDEVDGGPGNNDVRQRGDDWPVLEKLDHLQNLVDAALPPAILPAPLASARRLGTVNVTIDQAAGQSDPATSGSPLFTVVFDRSVSDFTAADIVLGGDAADAEVQQVQPVGNDGTTYNVLVEGMSSHGTVVVSVPAGAVHDAAGLPNAASVSTENAVTYEGPIARRFDFGTSRSPVESGYERVSNLTRYRPDLGYGWASGRITRAVRPGPPGLDRDLNGTRNGTFVVDLPNGFYRVDILLGDRSAPHDQMGIA
ncbi:MAG: hypothetical protein JJ992_21315, partial [Planctomycetes bacterium]|nr:hypothetical protein [Planctomycetota bacterium]